MSKTDNHDMNFVYKITGFSQRTIDNLINMFAKESNNVRLDGCKLIYKVLIQNKDHINKEKYPEIFYSAIIVGLNKLKISKAKAVTMDRGSNSEQGKRITEERMNQIDEKYTIPRTAKKREVIEQNYHEIYQMRKQKFSFRKIAKYFAKYHHIKISYSYIQKVFKQLSNCKMNL
ncbi:hypothetical protein MHK_004032 [Candidatus Magnetomorum sp. HK-1]|nr:hypothetical protein MHK_004032 [Candidatus Magnetomorum sp. HK-1]